MGSNRGYEFWCEEMSGDQDKLTGDNHPVVSSIHVEVLQCVDQCFRQLGLSQQQVLRERLRQWPQHARPQNPHPAVTVFLSRLAPWRRSRCRDNR